MKSAACFSLCFLLVAGCKPELEEKRMYREVVLTAPSASPAEKPDSGLPEGHPEVSGMDASSLPPSMRAGAGVSLSWTAPEGWTEEAGSGMRQASFSPADSDVLCTIVALSGSAGGLESNISRWLGQVDLSLPHDELHTFVEKLENGSTESGLIVKWVDFNPLVADPTQPSVKAAILEKEGSTVFVKMTGSAEELDAAEGGLRSLVGSIQ